MLDLSRFMKISGFSEKYESPIGENIICCYWYNQGIISNVYRIYFLSGLDINGDINEKWLL